MPRRFPKIFQLGMKPIADIFAGPVEITEKIDGSQFNFGLENGNVWMLSKGAEVHLNDGNKMFEIAAQRVHDWASTGRLREGWSYHGEYLQAPRHNTLKYERVPKNNIALFGAVSNEGGYIDHPGLGDLAEELECDVVPLVEYGELEGRSFSEWLDVHLERESYLGGARVEGVVVKNYLRDCLVGGQYIPIMMGKYVSENFKEKHKVSWGKNNPGNLEKIAEALAATPRWEKAIQFLRDSGKLEESPRDIGPLLERIHRDIDEEEQEFIKDTLFKLFRKDILRMATRGFPEWYKRRLLEND